MFPGSNPPSRTRAAFRKHPCGGFVNGRFAEVYFDGELTADNGLTYGAKIHFNTSDRSTNVTTAYPGRQYIYLKGDWGSMEFGNWIGADSGLNICPLACTYKGFGGLDTPYHSYIQKPAGAINNHINPYWFDQSPKATYYTPVVNGFQAGVSYTPSSKHRTDYSTFFNRGPTGATPENDGDWKDVVGLGAQWNGDFGGTTVGFSAVGAISDDMKGLSDGETSQGLALLVNSGYTLEEALDLVNFLKEADVQREGLGYYELTGKVGFGGFVFAGTWWDFGDGEALKGLDQEWTGWAVDASYAFGPYGLEVQYAHAEKSWDIQPLGTLMSSDFDGWNVSLGYSVAPGLKWYGEVTHGSFDVMGTGEANGDGEYSGTVFLSGLYLNF